MSIQGSSPDGGHGTLVLQTTDATAAGSTHEFLNSKLSFRVDESGQEVCFVMSGEDEVGVMMGWEKPISGYYPRHYFLSIMSALSPSGTHRQVATRR